MPKEIRFGAFVREISVRQNRVSYSDLVPPVRHDAQGRVLPYSPARIRLRPIDAYRLIRPYVGVRLSEQSRAVIPLALYLVLFQLLILRQSVVDSWEITAGLTAVILGLMLFMEGLKIGLMPFGETLGATLPAKSPLPVVLAVAFLLGIGVTFAEPAIGALKAAGSIVRVDGAPYLYALLNEWTGALVLVVGVGVGAAAVLGTLRFLYGWSLKPLIYATLLPTLGLAGYIMVRPELAKTLGLAWDCGAVTTGPVTVPLVLALGIGIAASTGKDTSSLSGFGIVTLASLFPILGVELLAVYLAQTTSPQAIMAAAAAAGGAAGVRAWHEQSPWVEIIGGVQAIVPLVLLLLLVLRLLLREKLKHPGNIAYGITLAVLGMVIFNVGLSYGLAKLGGQSGALVPAAFTNVAVVDASPLYGFGVGLMIALLFAWILGFGATLAEPALNALGLTVESLTNGALRKSELTYAVSFGVGCGIALGVAKIVLDLPIAWLIVPGYLLAVILSWLSTEEFVNVAWDSAGVTTGPVTVPLVLSMGLGFGDAVGVVEGFGILSMASIGPILSVLGTGLWIQWKVSRRHRVYDGSVSLDEAQEAVS